MRCAWRSHWFRRECWYYGQNHRYVTKQQAIADIPGICGIARPESGGHANFDETRTRMTHPLEAAYVPNTSDQKIYDRLYAVYKDLHESFGVATGEKDLSQVMKELPSIADDGQG